MMDKNINDSIHLQFFEFNDGEYSRSNCSADGTYLFGELGSLSQNATFVQEHALVCDRSKFMDADVNAKLQYSTNTTFGDDLKFCPGYASDFGCMESVVSVSDVAEGSSIVSDYTSLLSEHQTDVQHFCSSGGYLDGYDRVLGETAFASSLVGNDADLGSGFTYNASITSTTMCVHPCNTISHILANIDELCAKYHASQLDDFCTVPCDTSGKVDLTTLRDFCTTIPVANAVSTLLASPLTLLPMALVAGYVLDTTFDQLSSWLAGYREKE